MWQVPGPGWAGGWLMLSQRVRVLGPEAEGKVREAPRTEQVSVEGPDTLREQASGHHFGALRAW